MFNERKRVREREGRKKGRGKKGTEEYSIVATWSLQLSQLFVVKRDKKKRNQLIICIKNTTGKKNLASYFIAMTP